ncbi:hypothetical protein [Pelagibaculum spongiae]|uniref:Uncharacterized protein n=1 Tax=Pelagibaculum spongiae TaxID=2080658 RepID=A0A2V1GRU6_9GAMM|nr:hypothetical protein [Pelagibaculum spongiae]PVZ67721.1 hypothetical protein DC094_14905 [Pelagibaculum spongiae]
MEGLLHVFGRQKKITFQWGVVPEFNKGILRNNNKFPGSSWNKNVAFIMFNAMVILEKII